MRILKKGDNNMNVGNYLESFYDKEPPGVKTSAIRWLRRTRGETAAVPKSRMPNSFGTCFQEQLSYPRHPSHPPNPRSILRS